jgi:hypothetical protein
VADQLTCTGIKQRLQRHRAHLRIAEGLRRKRLAESLGYLSRVFYERELIWLHGQLTA